MRGCANAYAHANLDVDVYVHVFVFVPVHVSACALVSAHASENVGSYACVYGDWCVHGA